VYPEDFGASYPLLWLLVPPSGTCTPG